MKKRFTILFVTLLVVASTLFAVSMTSFGGFAATSKRTLTFSNMQEQTIGTTKVQLKNELVKTVENQSAHGKISVMTENGEKFVRLQATQDTGFFALDGGFTDTALPGTYKVKLVIRLGNANGGDYTLQDGNGKDLAFRFIRSGSTKEKTEILQNLYADLTADANGFKTIEYQETLNNNCTLFWLYMYATTGSYVDVKEITIEGNFNAQQSQTETTTIADVYLPKTGIVNAPIVVQEVTDVLPSKTGERPAVTLINIDKDMNVLSSNGVLTTATTFIDDYKASLIPAFIIDSADEATKLATLIKEKNLIDCYVVATKENANLVKQVRLANDVTKLITGALIFDDLNSETARKEARTLVVDNMSFVAISKAPLTEEATRYFNTRQIAIWSFANNKAGVYQGISNGYHGIVSENASMVYDVYESITEKTVSGKPVVIAHRGVNLDADNPYPENTIIAIKAAKELYNADAVEIDLKTTKDGHLILMHDTDVKRTTNGEGAYSSKTLAQIKALTVDIVPGKETKVPTFEEVCQELQNLDVVVYCHISSVSNKNMGAASYLVEKYGVQDKIVFFLSHSTTNIKYNSTNTTKVSDTTYGFTNRNVVMSGAMYVLGDTRAFETLTNVKDALQTMRTNLCPINFQPLFYPYTKYAPATYDSLWANDTFYYQLACRGMVSSHSVTDTSATLNSTLVTESGAIGALTNTPQYTTDWHYYIDATNQTVKVGETINLTAKVKLCNGEVSEKCGVIFLDKELTAKDGSYTLNEEGTATAIFYLDRTAYGETYRVYSSPVTITFADDKGGCGSVIGALSIATSVTLLGGAILVFKKKH
ncbi:MAG: glycerophosphodiester phosphodiesterase family protein [Clostridiales bacterium]|nr:glycerophosphodiester phosphodiesterase family protein [Clostridiales bacterium]